MHAKECSDEATLPRNMARISFSRYQDSQGHADAVHTESQSLVNSRVDKSAVDRNLRARCALFSSRLILGIDRWTDSLMYPRYIAVSDMILLLNYDRG